MKYKVTIGIPVFQSRDYIEKTMLSALGQTFPDIEYLVVDDGVNDGSMEIIERLQSEHPRGKCIRILYHDCNLGVGAARNRILNEAHGHFLYFLDSDDIIELDTIEILIDKQKRYGAEVVYGSMDMIDCIGNIPMHTFRFPDICFMSENEMATYAFKNYNTFQISICNCLMDLDFLRNTHLHFINANYWEDLVFTYEMAIRVKRAVFVSTVTYHYFCRPGSLSHYQERERIEKNEIMKNVSMINYLKGKCPLLKGRPYLPYFCYNLEMNSFYCVCHVFKKAARISPKIEERELRLFMNYPLPFMDVIRFREKRLHNMVLWLVAHLPVSLFVPVVKQMGRIKGIL